MTATDTIASTLLVAIDISKHRHEVLIGIPGKKRRRRFTAMNTLEDFQRLSAALASYGLPVRIGFEATARMIPADAPLIVKERVLPIHFDAALLGAGRNTMTLHSSAWPRARGRVSA